jgi:hypothetical protein
MKVCFVRWQKIELKNLCVGKKKEIKNEALAWLFKAVSSSSFFVISQFNKSRKVQS